MPRASSSKSRCAYADPLSTAKTARAKKPKPQLSEEEKLLKKIEAAQRKEEREKKKTWEASLTEWAGGNDYRGITFPNGTKVLFKSDAKREFGLSDKDIASLRFQGFACSKKRVMSLDDLKAHAGRKYKATGVPYPAMRYPPASMTKTNDHLTGLTGRSDNFISRMFRPY